MTDNVTPIAAPTQPKPRTSSDVQADYNNTLFRLGVATRTIQEQEREVKMFGEALDTLRLEYNTLYKQEQATAAAVAAATQPTPPAPTAVATAPSAEASS
jgi:hypothetical protein